MWITILRFLKPLAPYILAVVAVMFAYSWIYNRGKQDGIAQAYEGAIAETKKIVAKMPDLKCDCPKVQPCPDFDKMKGKNITVNLVQNYRMEVEGDSLVMDKFSDVVKRHLEELKVVRTKRL